MLITPRIIRRPRPTRTTPFAAGLLAVLTLFSPLEEGSGQETGPQECAALITAAGGEQAEGRRENGGGDSVRMPDPVLLALLASLPEPGAVRSLPALFETDPSYAYLAAAPELSTAVDAHLKAFRTLAPERVGVECVAELIASLRSTILEGYATLPFYQLDFLDAPLQLQAAPPVPERFSVELDFSAARALVEIVGVPGASAEQVDRTIDTDLFRALLNHRNQDFYPIRLTREILVASLVRAASDAPIDRLYRYAFPLGLLHYSELREHRERFDRLIADLEANETGLVANIAAMILPYTPPDLHFSRTVHFTFGDGADGWVSDGIAAVDLEFFKDDLDRLVTVLAHETFHAVQSAARRGDMRDHTDARQRELVGILETIYREGTANYIAPAQEKSESEQRSLALEGLTMLEELHMVLASDRVDEARARDLRNRGVQGAGPFYWLGREMTGVIDEALGPRAIATALEDGGVRFFQLYMTARKRGPSIGLPAFSDSLAAAVAELEHLQQAQNHP